jgi:hypothetical protein
MAKGLMQGNGELNVLDVMPLGVRVAQLYN